MKSVVARCVLVLASLLAVSACGDPAESVQDSSTCPGDSCADDTRQRFDTISAIDGVVEVKSVSRSYGLDRGSARTAEVTSAAADKESLVQVGLAVMRALDEWPQIADGAANVVVEPVNAGESVTLVLDGDYVCEEIDRVRRPCGPDNSWLITGEKVGATDN